MRRCLFVDDSSVILKCASRILDGPDMQVIGAETGRQALAYCEMDMPDIVVVDTTLPDMTTLDFLNKLRDIRSAVTPQIMLCMIEFDIGTYMRARRAGAHGYLQKPFDRTLLLNAFRSMESKTAA